MTVVSTKAVQIRTGKRLEKPRAYTHYNISSILQYVEPMLCNVPIARQQILNNATVGLQQWRSCVFYVICAEVL
jgi:hypothetical protein